MTRFLFILCYLTAINSWGQTPMIRNAQNVTYDFSCMEDDNLGFFINLGSDFEKAVLGTLADSVSLDEEIAYGEDALAEIELEYYIFDSGKEVARLKNILQALEKVLSNPVGYNYYMYLLDSPELNAFTIGGKIFVTNAMYDFCENDDELACIIGHEIAHNELGHINENLQKVKTAQNFGDVGLLASDVMSAVTSSFNQKNECFADFIGIDLAKAANYRGCASVDLWERMSLNNSGDTEVYKIFSTHPYSNTRANCSMNHIQSNYSIDCD